MSSGRRTRSKMPLGSPGLRNHQLQPQQPAGQLMPPFLDDALLDLRGDDPPAPDHPLPDLPQPVTPVAPALQHSLHLLRCLQHLQHNMAAHSLLLLHHVAPLASDSNLTLTGSVMHHSSQFLKMRKRHQLPSLHLSLQLLTRSLTRSQRMRKQLKLHTRYGVPSWREWAFTLSMWDGN